MTKASIWWGNRQGIMGADKPECQVLLLGQVICPVVLAGLGALSPETVIGARCQ